MFIVVDVELKKKKKTTKKNKYKIYKGITKVVVKVVLKAAQAFFSNGSIWHGAWFEMKN